MLKIQTYIILFLVGMLLSTDVLSQDYSVQLLPFNTRKFDEYGAVYFDNGIMFCTNRRGNIFINYFSDRDNMPLTDLYVVAQMRRSKWGEPALFDKKFKTHFNDGPATFDDKEKLMFFSQNIYSDKKIGNSLERGNMMGLYYSKERRKIWQDQKAFPHNSGIHNLTHPSLTPDGLTLYFVSDMDGGYGGKDIYVSRLENNEWTEPENLGPNVNTEGDEQFPFIHQTGRLYFSSNGHEGARRLDIYYTEQVNGNWHTPIHMEEPINSRYNDFGIIVDDFNKTGLFSSDRGRSDDIYSFVTYYPMFENMLEQIENSYCYEFFEGGTANTDTMNVKYEWDLGDGTKVRALRTEHCYEDIGDYTVQLNVIDGVTGDVWFNEATYLVQVGNEEQPYINAPDTVIAGKEITVDARQTNLPNMNIRTYFWDFGDGRRTRGIEKTHVYSSPGVYIIQLGVKSRPDDQGNEQTEGVFKKIVVLDPRSVRLRDRL